MSNQRILIVDDEPNILQGYQRQLHKRFAVDTAVGPLDGLKAIESHGPYAVVVSDMRMPEMNGVQFLSKVKKITPDTVRIMLTGNADQQTATDAVNDGHVFRFLTKPCSSDALSKALLAGLEQHQLIMVERELLSKTLSGAVSLLTDVLSLVNPVAFGRSSRIRQIAIDLCQRLPEACRWEVELAALLSQVGCVTVPEQTLAKYYGGADLTERERRAFQSHPSIGQKLVGKIPRLSGVAETIAYQEKHYDGTGVPSDDRKQEAIPLGARILKLALDFDSLVSAGQSHESALHELNNRSGWYDPHLMNVLADIQDTNYAVKSVMLDELEENMVFDEHVVTSQGEVLVARGQQARPSTCERLRMFSKTTRGVREPIRIRYRVADSPTPAEVNSS